MAEDPKDPKPEKPVESPPPNVVPPPFDVVIEGFGQHKVPEIPRKWEILDENE